MTRFREECPEAYGLAFRSWPANRSRPNHRLIRVATRAVAAATTGRIGRRYRAWAAPPPAACCAVTTIGTSARTALQIQAASDGCAPSRCGRGERDDRTARAMAALTTPTATAAMR